MVKFNVLLTGVSKFPELIINFKLELMALGKESLLLVENDSDANMMVDISDINPTTNLTEEAIWVLETARSLKLYERKRRRIIKKHKQKLLVASTDIIKSANRKHIN